MDDIEARRREAAAHTPEEFLVELTKTAYPFGDYYFARQSPKTSNWVFGYTNELPLQHGGGIELMLPNEIVVLLASQLSTARQQLEEMEKDRDYWKDLYRDLTKS